MLTKEDLGEIFSDWYFCKATKREYRAFFAEITAYPGAVVMYVPKLDLIELLEVSDTYDVHHLDCTLDDAERKTVKEYVYEHR